MKKKIATYLLLSFSLVSEGFAWGSVDNKKADWEFLPSAINTTDTISSISLLGDKVIFTRNDSTFTSETDSTSLDLIINSDESNKWNSQGISQATYDSTNAILYFTSNGKLYSANLTSDMKLSAKKALIIDGVTNVRNDFENSSIACRNWRYKERDTVKIYNPAVANNGKRIYFSAEIAGGMGGRDIWFIDKIAGKSNKWSKPQNISRMGLPANDTTSAPSNNINSSSDEDYPFLVNDSTIIFSSNRKAQLAGWNLYSAEIKDGAKADFMLGQEINSDGDDKAYIQTKRSAYILSNRNGADNIFSPSHYDISKSDELLADVSATEPQEESASEGKEIAENTTPSQPKDAVTNTQKGENKESKDTNNTKEPQKEAPKLSKEGNTYTLYFKFNEDIMVENYDKEIDEIKAYINNYPNSKFAIGGHTDHTGVDTYNKELSIKRAKKVYDLLIKRGVNPKQLTYKGYGASRPKVKNAVNDEELQMNRRVEIVKEGK